MNLRQLFLQHMAQTSDAPLALEIVKAEGCTLTGADGRTYIDLIGGISVANVGHRHPRVVQAIKDQADQYLHLMVYGEFVQSPQVVYAERLVRHLPASLNSVYFTNSGTEAVEGAMKLAKRVTGRTGMVAFNNSYHGSTQGALSIIGSEYWRNGFRPLLPDITHLDYNSWEQLQQITENTASVIVETVQAEAGIIAPQNGWLQALAHRCHETGALLILDEIQAGLGRTGRLWAFEHFDVVPDVLLLGKGLGGGMPLGAFVADRKLMSSLSHQPVLGHITTFGGHPVCCAAGLAAFEVLTQEKLWEKAEEKTHLFMEQLAFKNIRHIGLWMSLSFANFNICKQVIDQCLTEGVLTDWFLFAPESLRISPPLIISADEIRQAAVVINRALHDAGHHDE